MGKTWKKRDGHNKSVKTWNKNSDWDYQYDNKTHNSKSNHRSERKAKELRNHFENNFPDLNIEL